MTISPGAYPWGNHHNAWRPAHIHFSLFGRAFTQRLVTQMYFPDDPLFFQDPMFNSIADRDSGRRADDQRASTTTRPARAMGARVPLGHRASGRQTRRRPRSSHAWPRPPDRRPVPDDRAALAGWADVGPKARPGPDPPLRQGPRRRGRGRPRRAGRDLAGRRRRHASTNRGLPRLRPRADERRRRARDLHRQARRDGDGQAPHIDVHVLPAGCSTVASRGSTSRTSDGNGDPVLRRAPKPRRDTLLVHPSDDGYRFDVTCRASGETVFFTLLTLFAGVSPAAALPRGLRTAPGCGRCSTSRPRSLAPGGAST